MPHRSPLLSTLRKAALHYLTHALADLGQPFQGLVQSEVRLSPPGDGKIGLVHEAGRNEGVPTRSPRSLRRRSVIWSRSPLSSRAGSFMNDVRDSAVGTLAPCRSNDSWFEDGPRKQLPQQLPQRPPPCRCPSDAAHVAFRACPTRIRVQRHVSGQLSPSSHASVVAFHIGAHDASIDEVRSTSGALAACGDPTRPVDTPQTATPAAAISAAAVQFHARNLGTLAAR